MKVVSLLYDKNLQTGIGLDNGMQVDMSVAKKLYLTGNLVNVSLVTTIGGFHFRGKGSQIPKIIARKGVMNNGRSIKKQEVGSNVGGLHERRGTDERKSNRGLRGVNKTVQRREFRSGACNVSSDVGNKGAVQKETGVSDFNRWNLQCPKHFLGSLKEIEPLEMINKLVEAKNGLKHGACVTVLTAEEYKDAKCIDAGVGVLAIKNDGDICSVVKTGVSKNTAKDLMLIALSNGGYKLDCYSIDNGLPNMYINFGFIPVCRVKWNSEFRPDDWDDADGTPDIICLYHSGLSEDKILKKRSQKEFGTLDDFSVPYITEMFSDVKLDEEYEKALFYRDAVMEKHRKFRS